MSVADQVEVLRREGSAKIRENKPEEAIALFDQALTVADTEELRELVTIYKAEALVSLERIDEPEVTALPRIVLRRRSTRHVFLASYTLLYRYRIENEYERARFYGRQALQVVDEMEGENWKSLILTELGNVAVFDSRFSEAVEYFEQALTATTHQSHVDFQRAFILQNLGYSNLLLDRTETGVALIHEAIALMEQADAEGYVAESYIDLCLGYLDLEDFESARHYGEAGLELATENRQIRNAHYLLGEVCHRTGDMEAATSHFEHLATYYPDFPHLTDLLLAIDLRKMVNLKLS